jgi:hypothetical protein
MLVTTLPTTTKKLIRWREIAPAEVHKDPFPLVSQSLATIELSRAKASALPAGNSCGLWLFRTRARPLLMRL